MEYSGSFKNILRLAAIENVNIQSQTCTVRMYDRIEDKRYTCALPQAVMGTDQGLFGYPDPGTLVLVGWGYNERPHIVSTVPNSSFSKDLTSDSNVSNVLAEAVGYPVIGPGEIALTGKLGSGLFLRNTGSLELNSSRSFLEFRSDDLMTRSDLGISYNSARYQVAGTVLRDLRTVSSDRESGQDKLTDLSFLDVLSQVGREPGDKVAALPTNVGKPSQIFRNPPFNEVRHLYQEFDQSFQVGTVDQESERQRSTAQTSYISQPNSRSNTVYDVLNLSTAIPNNLAESVIGTLVDIYGNILDLNRNVIDFGDDATVKSSPERIRYLAALGRRSIKYHFEINSKKEATGTVAADSLSGRDLPIGDSHSRWSVDVDGEGLTKINIPSSSNIGNIPLLARYVNQNSIGTVGQELIGGNRPERDISHLAFGDTRGDGISVPDTYSPADLGTKSRLRYRSAYHDLINTAPQSLRNLPSRGAAAVGTFTSGINSAAGDGTLSGAAQAAGQAGLPSGPGLINLGGFNKAILDGLNNLYGPDGSVAGQANAGGRSIHANLDGSLELNIGRDQIDHKSLVLDTSGGVLARLGRMRESSQSASLISQLDGSVFIQVGGDQVEGDDEVDDPRVRLSVVGSAGTDEIIIDKKYVKIKSTNKNIILETTNDIILSAGGKILLMGRTVGIHGEVDVDGNILRGPERVAAKSGKEF